MEKYSLYAERYLTPHIKLLLVRYRFIILDLRLIERSLIILSLISIKSFKYWCHGCLIACRVRAFFFFFLLLVDFLRLLSIEYILTWLIVFIIDFKFFFLDDLI